MQEGARGEGQVGFGGLRSALGVEPKKPFDHVVSFVNVR